MIELEPIKYLTEDCHGYTIIEDFEKWISELEEVDIG